MVRIADRADQHGGDAEDAGDVGALPPDSNDLNNNGNPLNRCRSMHAAIRARSKARSTWARSSFSAGPVISNPDAVIAVAGTGPIALDIAAPTDSDGTTPTITLNTVPTYGTVQYFNGTTFVTVSAVTALTPAELASLEYTPPASGEFGGQTISYTATDNGASVTARSR